MKEITVGIPTKNRYYTTLPLTLISIINQSVLPKHIIIYDDTDLDKRIDLRNIPNYQYIFSLIQKKNITFEVIFGNNSGQVTGHNVIMNISKTDLIWRIDDDEIAEYNTLEKLLNIYENNEKVGAVSCLILDPKGYQVAGDDYENNNKMNEIYFRENTQWIKQKEKLIKAEHLYSSFLYDRRANEQFCSELSPVGHREETIFTHSLFRKGFKLLIDTSTTIWHFRNPEGGIRSDIKKEYWDKDEAIFKRKLESWQYDFNLKYDKLILNENGLGDVLCFLRILPELQKKYKKIIIGSFYPGVFKDYPDIQIMHPLQMKDIIGDKEADKQNVYRYLWQENDKNRKLHLLEAYKEMFLEEKY